MKKFELYTKFHLNMFLWFNWEYSIIGSDNGMAAIGRQAIIWSNHNQVYERIYASSDPNELNTITIAANRISIAMQLIWISGAMFPFRDCD